MAPPQETSIQLANGRIDAANNMILRHSKKLPGNPSSFSDYRDYLEAVPEFQGLHLTMTRDANIAASVAAYSIFKTVDNGHPTIDRAMDYMFERREGENMMQHPYFGYLPADAPFEPAPSV